MNKSSASLKRQDFVPTLELSENERRPAVGVPPSLPRPFRPEGKTHIHYPREFKIHVTLEALRERMPQCEIGEIYGVPQSLISIWKKAAVEAIRGNIHYKTRKTRGSMLLEKVTSGAPRGDGQEEEEEEGDAAPAELTPEAAQHLCSILRGAARQLERDPAALQKLIRHELAG
jgi:hypothetical protein